MYPDRPTQLDAALLYVDYDTFAYATLVARLQKVFADQMPVKLGAHEDGSFAVISIDTVVLKVSQNQEPLDPQGFQAALSSPFTQHTKPNAPTIVQNHRKNIFVTVGGDDILLPDFAPGEIAPEMQELLDEVRPSAKKPNAILHANRVYIAQMVISELCAMNQPDLIHWLQSDQFLVPSQMQVAHDPTAIALQMHPVIYSSGPDKRGRQMIGFDAFGSEHIIGHHVVVEETALLFEDVFDAVQDFVQAVQKSGDIPAHNQTVTLKSGARFKVHHMPASEKHPRPYLRLDVLKLEGKSQTPAKQTGMISRVIRTLFSKSLHMLIVLVLALVFGKLLSGTEGLEIVSILGN